MNRGLDTTEAITPDSLEIIAGNGLSFVIKYCEDSESFPRKRLTHQERTLCHAAGVACGFVFETSNQATHFTSDQGSADAKAALAYFELLGVPKDQGIACFYAIDFDADLNQVHDYAVAFHEAFEVSGYLTGVYGSGDICDDLKSEGYCFYTWLANATGWSGYLRWHGQEDILQLSGSVAGLASDPDQAESLAWAWCP